MGFQEINAESNRTIECYSKSRGVSIEKMRFLGQGIDGFVIEVGNKGVGIAAKFFKRQQNYQAEKNVYLRLDGASSIGCFAVPVLLGYDDDLMVIEMSIVSAPYMLDFAKADLDVKTEYPEHVREDTLRDMQETFGERWPTVRSAIWELERRFGIFYHDANSRNICFGDD